MSRQARKRSSEGVYHVMLRGIDGRDIFIETRIIVSLLKS